MLLPFIETATRSERDISHASDRSAVHAWTHRTHPTFGDLVRAYPGRVAVLSVAPLFLADVQSINALVHGVNSPPVAAFVLGLVAFAVVATRHSLASFRTESLEVDLFDRGS